MKQTLSTALVAAAMLGQSFALETCQALVMSGGGSNGAWEAGVIWGLAHYGNESDFYYEWVSGVSAGSINTLGFVGWAPNEVYDMTEWLVGLYAAITNDQLFSFWPNWTDTDHLEEYLLSNPSFLNDEKAVQFMTE